MNTTQLKRFAAEARNKLREGVKGRLIRLGFSLGSQASLPDNVDLLLQPRVKRPEIVDGGGVWKGKPVSTAFVNNWNELYNHIKQIGIKQMIEEGAYTWFNRLVAIRILAKNNLCDAVLQYVDSARTPRIVDEARTKLTYSEYLIVDNEDGSQHSVLSINLFGQTYKLYDISYKLFEEDSLVTEQFAVLINAWVNNNPIISTCFDADSKHFIELLLPDDIRNEGGFLDMLNSADFISDEDYRSPELIGWLYQFYISERKDEVFAKKGKYDADEIAPATQIFTPNWIVKYMVQNTVGRIYLDANPTEKRMAEGWKYLVEPSDSEKEAINYKLSTINYDSLESLKVADLACGSGHILNECFDLLYELYIHEGYSRREAITNIFEHNLTGIDIDLRAKQLATFALLLKACQRDSSFADAHCLPRVYDMPKIDRYTFRDTAGHFDCAYQIKLDYPNKVHEELDAAFTLMENADTLGSIMKFDISSKTREYLVQAVAAYHAEPQHEDAFAPLVDGYKMILALTEKYDAIVMNPPYMGGGNMNVTLSNYVKANYPAGKADLATVFVEMSPQHLVDKGKYAFIIPPSWMFLSGFESLRREIIDNQSIDSLLHLSRGVFGADFGSSSAVISNQKGDNASGNYFRLIERTFQEFDQKHLRMLFEKTLENHDFRYKFVDYSKDVEEIEYSEDGAIIYYPNIPQTNFEKIPGSPIGYWVSEKVIQAFSHQINQIAYARTGMATGDNDKYIRLWHEVSLAKIGFGLNRQQAKTSELKWFPYAKGGSFRRWYGNRDWIVNWFNDGYELQNTLHENGKRIKAHNFNLDSIFKPHIGWSDICSGGLSFRCFDRGFIFDSSGTAGFVKEDTNYLKVLGYLNTHIVNNLGKLLNPTFHFTPGNFSSLPWKSNVSVDSFVSDCIYISKSDWDAHETSWDFQENEIVGLNTESKYMDLVYGIYEGTGIEVDLAAPQFDSLEWRTDLIKAKWTNKFERLHANEEELNRRFIEIYGLQDELTPDVPLNEVTILQQGEIEIVDNLYLIVNNGGEERPADDQTAKFIKEHKSEATLQPDGTYKLYDISYKLLKWHDDVLMKQLISYAVGCMMGRYRLDRPGLAVAHPDPTPAELEEYNLYLITLLYLKIC